MLSQFSVKELCSAGFFFRCRVIPSFGITYYW
jgi:hypothetical protein